MVVDLPGAECCLRVVRRIMFSLPFKSSCWWMNEISGFFCEPFALRMLNDYDYRTTDWHNSIGLFICCRAFGFHVVTIAHTRGQGSLWAVCISVCQSYFVFVIVRVCFFLSHRHTRANMPTHNGSKNTHTQTVAPIQVTSKTQNSGCQLELARTSRRVIAWRPHRQKAV